MSSERCWSLVQVLNKFPVIQHFLFGSLMSVDEAETSPRTEPSSSQQTRNQQSPADVTVTSKLSADVTMAPQASADVSMTSQSTVLPGAVFKTPSPVPQTEPL